MCITLFIKTLTEMKKYLLFLISGILAFTSCDMLGDIFDQDKENEKEIPDVENAWTPIEGQQVSQIVWENTKKSGTWKFTYDESGRIKVVTSTIGSTTDTWKFYYREESIVVKENGSTEYEFKLNESGFTTELYKNGKLHTEFNIDGTGRVHSCQTLNSNSFEFFWSQGNLMSITHPSVSASPVALTSYTGIRNMTNIDCTALIGDVWYEFEYYVKSGGLTPFALFGIYGKSCEELPASSTWNNSTRSFTYEYQSDGCPKHITSSIGERYTFTY